MSRLSDNKLAEITALKDELIMALERYVYGNGPDNPDYAHLTVEEAEEILAKAKEVK